MLSSFRGRLQAGIEKLRWYADLIGERFRAESALVSLLGHAYNLERRQDEAAARAGYRLMELWDVEEANVFEDAVVAEALSEIRDLDEEIGSLKEQASLVSEVEA